jgi:hypothetical protein
MVKSRSLAAVALVAILAMAGVTLGEFAHTDDGCVVETHCLACRHAMAAAGGSVSTPIVISPTLGDFSPVAIDYRAAERTADLPSAPLRAPPSPSTRPAV